MPEDFYTATFYRYGTSLSVKIVVRTQNQLSNPLRCCVAKSTDTKYHLAANFLCSLR